MACRGRTTSSPFRRSSTMATWKFQMDRDGARRLTKTRCARTRSLPIDADEDHPRDDARPRHARRDSARCRPAGTGRAHRTTPAAACGAGYRPGPGGTGRDLLAWCIGARIEGGAGRPGGANPGRGPTCGGGDRQQTARGDGPHQRERQRHLSPRPGGYRHGLLGPQGQASQPVTVCLSGERSPTRASVRKWCALARVLAGCAAARRRRAGADGFWPVEDAVWERGYTRGVDRPRARGARGDRAGRRPDVAGEYCTGVWSFRHLLEARGADIVMIDVLRVGGVTAWLKVAALAQAFNLQVVSHLLPEIHVQLV